MPKPKQVKCRQCGKQIERDIARKMSNGYYVCSEKCEKQWQDEHTPKPKVNSADNRHALFTLIKGFAPDSNMRIISIQLAKMMKDNPDMTYGGITQTLYYLRDNGYDLSKSPLGLIPYKYDDARKHWEWKRAMRKQVAGWVPADDDAVIVRRDKEEDVFT